MHRRRLDRLFDGLEHSPFDGIVLSPGPTFYYVTGMPFMLMERPIVGIFVPGKTPIVVMPEFETAHLTGEEGFDVHTYGENPEEWPTAFKSAVSASDVGNSRLGVEPLCLRAQELFFLQAAAPDATFEAAGMVLDNLRASKDPDELATMKKATEIAEAGLTATIPSIQPGITEIELAALLTQNLLKAGAATRIPFGPIVAAGPNTANPHAVPTTRQVQEGDVVLIDWGAYYNGYCSDLTRVFAVGEVDPEMERVAAVVHAANEAARTTARPGVPASQVDKAARGVIASAGYGDRFTHRTGHGLGLEVHEPPYIREDNMATLDPGMTFTIEPGIYIAGLGGVRIEDDVVVTNEGAESLSTIGRDLVHLQ